MKIRRTLEECSRKTDVDRTAFPLNYLACRVSHHCLELLEKEKKRMYDLSDQVTARCGHALRKTCGIPCACELAQAIDSEELITLDRIHEFWRTFEIKDDGRGLRVSGLNDPSPELRYFDEIVGKARTRNPAVLRNIALLINKQLHPHQFCSAEPLITGNPRGRPKGSSSTKRDPSAWEYTERGRGRGSGSGRGRSSSQKRSRSSSSIRNPFGEDTETVPLDVFKNKDLLPGIILPYVEGVLDVRADGNCGFRALAHYMFQDQREYTSVRDAIANEIAAHRDQYATVYGDVDAALRRIRWGGGRCEGDHWMDAQDLYAFATLWKAVVFVFGYGDGRSLEHCSTIYPLRAEPRSEGPRREVVLGHLGNSYLHWICLDLKRNFPVPWTHVLWRHAHQRSVGSFPDLYRARHDVWLSLCAAAQL